MGKKAVEIRRVTERKIRPTRLSAAEREHLRSKAVYEGSAHHKRNPGDFGLQPPQAPRPDKTLCDEAKVYKRASADKLFASAIESGLVSEAKAAGDFPKQIWVLDGEGRVFDAMHGGSKQGTYHGYPIRRSDPFYSEVVRALGAK